MEPADARAVASALWAFHKAGIVHRDLTPQNLLRMADGRTTFIDFRERAPQANSSERPRRGYEQGESESQRERGSEHARPRRARGHGGGRAARAA